MYEIHGRTYGDAFETFVRRGQLVGADEEVHHTFYPMTPWQKVWCSGVEGKCRGVTAWTR